MSETVSATVNGNEMRGEVLNPTGVEMTIDQTGPGVTVILSLPTEVALRRGTLDHIQSESDLHHQFALGETLVNPSHLRLVVQQTQEHHTILRRPGVV